MQTQREPVNSTLTGSRPRNCTPSPRKSICLCLLHTLVASRQDWESFLLVEIVGTASLLLLASTTSVSMATGPFGVSSWGEMGGRWGLSGPWRYLSSMRAEGKPDFSGCQNSCTSRGNTWQIKSVRPSWVQDHVTEVRAFTWVSSVSVLWEACAHHC